MVKKKKLKSSSVIRYFAFKPKQLEGKKAQLLADNDCDHLADIPYIAYPYLTNDGRMIIKTRLTKGVIADMADHCADYGVEDPLTIGGVVAMKLTKAYVGETRKDVISKYPELDGTIEVKTEDGLEVVPKFPVKNWSFEK